MTIDRTGAREAVIAAWAFGFLFFCMLGLLALSDTQDRSVLMSSMAVPEGHETRPN
jgi:hypothetical protein